MKQKGKSIGRILLLPVTVPLVILFFGLRTLFFLPFMVVRFLLLGIESLSVAYIAAGIVLCSTLAALGGGIFFIHYQNFITGGILITVALLLSGAISASYLRLKPDDPQRLSLFKGLSSVLGLVALALIGSGLYWGIWEKSVYIGWILAGSGVAMFIAMALGPLILMFGIAGNK